MSKKVFVKAAEGVPPEISVIYYDTDGNKTIRYHNKNGKIGSHAWRNNNPGNLAWGTGEHARATGAIGKAKKRTVRSLADEEYEKLLRAMETHEGWQEGFEEFIVVEKIVGVRLSRNVISEYLIQGDKGQRWISKPDAIVMAVAGLLCAIVVHTRRGIYLRAMHGSMSFKRMIS